MTFSPASEEVFEKIKAPEGIPLRRFESVKWLPGWMARIATLSDQRVLTVRTRRVNRRELRLYK
jgi:hypothetical protein